VSDITIRPYRAGEVSYAAHHLYETSGFIPTETKPNTEWCDKLLTEERWDLQTEASAFTQAVVEGLSDVEAGRALTLKQLQTRLGIASE